MDVDPSSHRALGVGEPTRAPVAMGRVEQPRHLISVIVRPIAARASLCNMLFHPQAPQMRLQLMESQTLVARVVAEVDTLKLR